MSATVSVIIPTYNRAQKLIRAVDSVLNQTFRDVEIIVVDDGSEDDTRAVLRRWGTKITVIEHRSRRGPSAARNSGIAQASAPLIAFLDSDDYWLPEKLAVQVSFFQDNPQAMACQTEEIWIRRGRRVNPKKRHKKPS
ncbi:MAG: glycosyltransferase family 2 protein, partial [Deltaproteobacteria bacterium]